MKLILRRFLWLSCSQVVCVEGEVRYSAVPPETGQVEEVVNIGEEENVEERAVALVEDGERTSE